MANTLVWSAKQQTPFRTHSITRDESDIIEQPWPVLDPQCDEDKVTVILPDMFALFLSETPRVNPNYARVKAESELWFSEYARP